jgi:cell wall-associated NlpC family hydrolase
MFRQRISYLPLVLALITSSFLFFSGCSKKPFVDVQDITRYSQNPIDYLNREIRKVPGEFLTNKAITDDFDGRYFIPWKLRKPPYPLAQVKWPWDSYTAENSFKENQRPIDDAWFKLMLLEANFDHYGKVSKPGIVIRTSSIRNFPTKKPVFKNFSIAGEGYPFDYAQNSITTSNEPVLISHYSTTKEWVYVITSYTSGWLSTHDVALIGSDIIDKWAKARQAMVLEDDVPFYDLDHQFVSNSRLGMMLPIMKVENDTYQGIIATDKSDGFVTFSIVRIPKNISISEPIPVKPQSIAVMAKSLMNKPYGWGGLYENRDCSSTLRDMFKPFSLWLPRNSKEQAKVGRVIDLSLLKPKQKEKEIIANAVPFQTLIYKPGHIMLYVGSEKGKAIVLHNMWGVTTVNKKIKERNIIGRTIISTLHVGKELKGYSQKDTFLHQITSMNVLTMKPTEQPVVIQPIKKVEKKEKPKKKRKSSRQRRKEAREAKEAKEKGLADPKATENKEAVLNPDALPQADAKTNTENKPATESKENKEEVTAENN